MSLSHLFVECIESSHGSSNGRLSFRKVCLRVSLFDADLRMDIIGYREMIPRSMNATNKKRKAARSNLDSGTVASTPSLSHSDLQIV